MPDLRHLAHDADTRTRGEFVACAGRDWARAIELMESHWTALVFHPETSDLFFEVLGKAPEDALLASPFVALHAEIIGRLPVGTTEFALPRGEARIAQEMSAGNARRLIEMSIFAMISRRVAGRPAEGVAIAAAARPLLRHAAVTRFSPAADLAPYWHLQAGQAELHAGDLAQARLSFGQAWALRHIDATGYVGPSTAPFLALLAALAMDSADESADLAHWREETAQIEADGGPALIEWDTMVRPMLVADVLQAVRAGRATSVTQQVDTLISQLAFDEIWSFSLFAVVCQQIETGAVARAGQTLATAAAAHPLDPTTVTAHHRLLAMSRTALALAGGRAAEARVHLEALDGSLLPHVVARLRQSLQALVADGGEETVALTRSEARVLRALAEAGPLTAVAESLHISHNTLKTHARNVYDKLGVASRAEAVEAGRRLGLIPDPPHHS